MRTAVRLWQYASHYGLRPLPKVSVSKWADNYRMLSAGISAEPGRWHTSRAPYQREIMDAFTQPGVDRVIVKSASQIGKSDILNNVIGRFAHLDPCTVMLVEPTVEMAEDYSKSRIAPMIRDTPALSKLFFDVKTRNGNNTILSKIFPGGRLVMCGANSPAGLASRPVRILLADEVDRFPDSAGTEGDPVDLAAKRTTTFWNRCIGLFSTPTNEGASRIEAEYELGTQEEWQHQCPNCGEFHTLRATDMACDYEESKTPAGQRLILIKNVSWRCPDCGFSFGEAEMKAAAAKYVSQNPAALENGCRSFFVNAFSSPWIGWKKIMREWLEAKGDPTREKVVVNTRFGEVYHEMGAFEDHMAFMRRREKYGAELPPGVLLLTAAVDVQDNRLEYEVCGWGAGEEAWGIEKGVILGAPDQKSVWAELTEILEKTYTFADGRGLRILRTFIDSGGHYTQAVYAYCRKYFARQRFAIKGQGGPGIPLIGKIGKAQGGKGIPLVMLGVDDGKQQVMNCLAIENAGEKYFHFPLDEEINGKKWQRGYDELYFKGIISEHKKIVKKGGRLHTVWEVQGKTRNEPLDLRVYNLACMKSLHADWAQLAGLLSGGDAKEAAPKAKQKKPLAIRSKKMNIW